MKRPLILLTNDDGVHADGIRSLARLVSEFADILVIAPSENRSCCGCALTVSTPVRITKIKWDSPEMTVFSATGTPADCVKLALEKTKDGQPISMIMSGINYGRNIGKGFFVSGTIGATIEGTLYGVPSVALSYDSYTAKAPYKCPSSIENNQTLKKEVVNLLKKVILNRDKIPSQNIININIPAVDTWRNEKPVYAPMCSSFWSSIPHKRINPKDEAYYWIAGSEEQPIAEKYKDSAIVEDGYISVTPISIEDMTNYLFIKNDPLGLDN